MDKVSQYQSPNTSNSFIAVVGGGQLALMLIEAGHRRNIKTGVQTPFKHDPAVSESSHLVLADIDDIDGTKKLSEFSKSITFENEWLNIENLRSLDLDIDFTPSLSSLEQLVDKLSQKELLTKLNIPTTKWIELKSIDINNLKLPSGFHFPLMAKSATGGYDGRGTIKIRDFNELVNVINKVNPSNWLLESWVDYDQELALVASRDRNGNIRNFPVVKTYQHNQICDWVYSPASISHELQLMIYNITTSLLIELNYVGVIAIEFFYGKDGLLVNEIAPRTHNSGHYSIEACNTSQFDQQICIVANLPVPEIQLISEGAIMINLLGLTEGNCLSLEERISRIESLEWANLHWYGKNLEKPGRKLGHVTVLLKELDIIEREKEAKNALHKIRSIWPIS